MRRDTVVLGKQVVQEEKRVYVLLKNRPEGHAPLAIQVLTDQFHEPPHD